MWTFEDPQPYLPPAVDTKSRSHRLQVDTETTHELTSWLRLQHGLTGAFEFIEQERTATRGVDAHRESADVSASLDLGPFPREFVGALRTRLNLTSAHGLRVVPALEVSSTPLEHFTLSLSGSRSYRIPGFEEMYFESSGIRGNPELAPEDAWGLDFTVSYDLDILHLETSAYRQWVLDSILFLPTTPYLVEAQNTGPVDVWGWEGSVGLRWRVLSFGAGASWVNATLDEVQHRQLPQRSPWSANASLTVDWWRIRGTIKGTFQDSFYLDRFNNRFEEGRIGLDASLMGRLPWGFRVTGRIRNILDKRDGIDAFQQPLPGFSWFFALEKSWGET